MSFTSLLSEETESCVSEDRPSLESTDDSECPLGKRAGILRDALNKTFERCIGSIKLAEFKEHFKEIDEHYPDLVEDLHDQLVSQLYTSIQAEAEGLCKEENVVKLLNSLDAMILESKSADVKQSWRPSGNPEEDVRDHLYQVKLQHKTALENHLQDLLKKNEAFLALVERNHNQILRFSKQNESYIEEMKTLISVLGQQLDKHTAEYLTWKGGSAPSMTSTVVWDSSNGHFAGNLQVTAVTKSEEMDIVKEKIHCQLMKRCNLND